MKYLILGLLIGWTAPTISWHITSGEFEKCVKAGIPPEDVYACAKTNAGYVLKLAAILEYNPIDKLWYAIK